MATGGIRPFGLACLIGQILYGRHSLNAWSGSNYCGGIVWGVLVIFRGGEAVSYPAFIFSLISRQNQGIINASMFPLP
jgi:hypothetical protein